MCSPASKLELSNIPILDVDADDEEDEHDAEELVSSMNHMSLHDSLHDSVRALHSPPLSGHMDNSRIDSSHTGELAVDHCEECVTGASSLSLLSVTESSAPADASGSLLGSTHSTGAHQSALSASLFTLSYRYTGWFSRAMLLVDVLVYLVGLTVSTSD